MKSLNLYGYSREHTVNILGYMSLNISCECKFYVIPSVNSSLFLLSVVNMCHQNNYSSVGINMTENLSYRKGWLIKIIIISYKVDVQPNEG